VSFFGKVFATLEIGPATFLMLGHCFPTQLNTKHGVPVNHDLEKQQKPLPTVLVVPCHVGDACSCLKILILCLPKASLLLLSDRSRNEEAWRGRDYSNLVRLNCSNQSIAIFSFRSAHDYQHTLCMVPSDSLLGHAKLKALDPRAMKNVLLHGH